MRKKRPDAMTVVAMLCVAVLIVWFVLLSLKACVS